VFSFDVRFQAARDLDIVAAARGRSGAFSFCDGFGGMKRTLMLRRAS